MAASPGRTSCDLQSAAREWRVGRGAYCVRVRPDKHMPCLHIQVDCRVSTKIHYKLSCLISCPCAEAGGSEVRTRRIQWDPDLDKASVTTSAVWRLRAVIITILKTTFANLVSLM